ncbi:MAG TPA: ATP-binding cassette domain-containing protein [Candidatus Eisenbacteria bacterium]
MSLAALAWPAARLGDAVGALATRSGLAAGSTAAAAPPERVALAGDQVIGRWIEAVARSLGLEAEATDVSYAGLEEVLRGAGPGLLRMPGAGDGFLALLGGSRSGVRFLGPDGIVHRRTLRAVRDSLGRGLEAPIVLEVDQLLAEAGVVKGRRGRARAAILRERLADASLTVGWLLRSHPGAGFWQQLGHAGLQRSLRTLAGAHAGQYLLWLLSWWMVGRGALEGRLEPGWLAAWGLLLLTLIPFRLLVTWSQGRFAIGAGALLKRRLLQGALKHEPEEVRHQGVGQLLGRVLESEAVESLALSGGTLGLVAGIELLLAAGVLAAGAGGALHALALAGWATLTLLIAKRYLRERRAWARERLALTGDMVERMVGHRTRLAQESRELWHEGEDQGVERYLAQSRAMDRSGAVLVALVPRGWLVLGLLGMAPAFVSGRHSPAALAVALGGVLLAYRAFEKLSRGLWQMTDAAIAWDQVAPLFQAAARPEVVGTPAFAAGGGQAAGPSPDGEMILDASDVVFRYRDRGEPVLRGCSLKVHRGERLLLQGASGGGKSTLASLLVGLRNPESGLILLHGLDRQTLGADSWRRRVAAAPQFHENHVLTETLAFNLLMGRRWPAEPQDLEEAETLCRELGLGELLDRMPSGLLQVVGETGWRLSHGEQSRVFIARALLQGADLLVLDESFAALDPETLDRTLRCVLDRAPTLLVIAHP